MRGRTRYAPTVSQMNFQINAKWLEFLAAVDSMQGHPIYMQILPQLQFLHCCAGIQLIVYTYCGFVNFLQFSAACGNRVGVFIFLPLAHLFPVNKLKRCRIEERIRQRQPSSSIVVLCLGTLWFR